MDKIYDEGFKKFYTFLDSLDLDNLSDKDKQLLANVSRISKVENYIKLFLDKVDIKEDMNILEIGPGYGYFCNLFLSYKKVKSYCLVDNNSMLRICKHTLIRKENVFLIEARKIFDSDKRFDCLISTNCFSELPNQFRYRLYNHVFNLCDKAFIIDGGDEKELTFNEELNNYLEGYYNKIAREKVYNDSQMCELFIVEK